MTFLSVAARNSYTLPPGSADGSRCGTSVRIGCEVLRLLPDVLPDEMPDELPEVLPEVLRECADDDDGTGFRRILYTGCGGACTGCCCCCCSGSGGGDGCTLRVRSIGGMLISDGAGGLRVLLFRVVATVPARLRWMLGIAGMRGSDGGREGTWFGVEEVTVV